MKLDYPWLAKIGGLSAAMGVQSWMNTLEYKAAYYDPAVDPISPECMGETIHVLWHEYLLFPLATRGHCNYALLVSRHRDADLLSQAATRMGFRLFRGSTRRGGATAMRELFRKTERTHLAITPDGPRGPRRQLAPGCIYLASRLERPLVAVGFGYDRPWRVNSWDRFAIPRPFHRARAVLSPKIHVPKDLDRDGIEHYRRRVELLLNRLTQEAETWAESSTRKIDEQPVFRRRSNGATITHRV